jgi:hypothetical protein
MIFLLIPDPDPQQLKFQFLVVLSLSPLGKQKRMKNLILNENLLQL